MSDQEKSWADRVAQWFDDRNLTKGSTPAKQYGKLLEELAELYSGSLAGDIHEVKDGIGDVLVVMRGMARQLDCPWPKWERPVSRPLPHCLSELIELIGRLPGSTAWRSADSFGFPCKTICILLSQVAIAHGLTIEECQEQAWGDIKDRIGYVHPLTGLFVKNEEMPEALKALIDG